VVKAKLKVEYVNPQGYLEETSVPVKVDVYRNPQFGVWRSGELIYSGVHRSGDIFEIPEPPRGRTYYFVYTWAGEKPYDYLEDETARDPYFRIAPDGYWHVGVVFHSKPVRRPSTVRRIARPTRTLKKSVVEEKEEFITSSAPSEISIPTSVTEPITVSEPLEEKESKAVSEPAKPEEYTLTFPSLEFPSWIWLVMIIIIVVVVIML